MLSVMGIAAGQDTAKFYNDNCSGCHSIGGGRTVGPDLKDVSHRQSREWLLRFLEDPEAVVASNDPYAKKLVSESDGMMMPKIEGVDPARATALLDFIENESISLPSSPAEKTAAGITFTPADTAHGKDILLGTRALSNGGPACISCHTLSGVASLGGGHLGPDLTRIYQKFGGAKNLMTWLASTPTPTMRAVYKDRPLTEDETAALAAYFQSTSLGTTEPAGTLPAMTFVLIGLGGSFVALALLDGFWRKRFRAVRRPLVARRRT